jgi:hypothetical protein
MSGTGSSLGLDRIQATRTTDNGIGIMQITQKTLQRTGETGKHYLDIVR